MRSIGIDSPASPCTGETFGLSQLAVSVGNPVKEESRNMQRSGLRIRGERGHPEVRAALIRYARWLRREFEFPIRVPAYLLPGSQVRTMHGDLASASIFLPWDRAVEPYIRIATGDYPQERREYGRDNALAMYLGSLSHEVVHYRQWIETGESWERGVAVRAHHLVDRYAETTDHP